MIAYAVLAAAVAAGGGLAAYSVAKRDAAADARDGSLRTYLRLAADQPAAATAAAAAVGDAAAMAELVARRNAEASKDAVLGMVASDSAAYRARDAETAAFLAARCDCALRRALADSLRGATVDEARAAMTVLDHVLETAPSGLRDRHVVFARPPVTVADMLRAVNAQKS